MDILYSPDHWTLKKKTVFTWLCIVRFKERSNLLLLIDRNVLRIITEILIGFRSVSIGTQCKVWGHLYTFTGIDWHRSSRKSKLRNKSACYICLRPSKYQDMHYRDYCFCPVHGLKFSLKEHLIRPWKIDHGRG